jgi:predicted metal-binding protein
MDARGEVISMEDAMMKLEELREFVVTIGASRAVIVPAGDLVVRTSAWAKCFIPACKFYGTSIMCPPHNPLTPDITKKIVDEYRYGILFQLDAPVADFVGDEWRKLHVKMELLHKHILAQLEGKAFHMGFTLALGFAAGECYLCVPEVRCAVLDGEECRHPLRARPAMEACGFDVFTIAKKVGWKIVPIGHTSQAHGIPCASLIGLVLVV